MTFLATQPKEERQQLQTLAQTPGDPDAFKPGIFEGAGTAAAVGLGRVGAIANQIVGEAEYQVGALFTRPLDELLDTDMTGFLNQELRYEPQALTASMTPDPMTTGIVGQVLYSLVGVGLPALGGGLIGGPAGAAATVGTFTSTGTFTDLTYQGVDPATAAGAALFEGGLMAAGVGLPAAISGKVALNTLLYGPGINVGQSLIAGQGNAAWLESRGYGEIAERYATYDAQMLAADVVLGAAFGWAGARSARVPRGTVPKPQTGDVDAALTALDQRHVEVDTAPGLAADLAGVKAHTANLTRATEQLLAGQPVETAPLQGAFVPKPPPRAEFADSALFRALEESGYFETAAEVQALEAELAARGRAVVDEPLPDLAAAMDRIEQGGGTFGRLTDVKIGDEYAAARWAVMEADEVAPSVTVSENQLRDRTRAASELQVNAIAANLDPNLLLSEFPTMDVGAPTLTADGKVVAGNGRALAVRKAYEGERGAAYREALVARAAALGLDPEAVAGLQKPVLVRVLQQAVDVQRAAIASNEAGAARMSNLEQARVDADRLPSMAALELPETGDFTAASAAPFVRGWLAQFPETQVGALLAEDGKLSQEGVTRLRNAVLFRAYGDSATLQRLVESTDPGARNVAAALVKAAPKVAEVRDGIARGEFYPFDITDAILRSSDLIEHIRDIGLSVDGWLAQLDLFNPGETPTTLAMLQFFDANKRSARAMTEMLTGYYDDVIAAGTPKQGDMLGNAPDPVAMLDKAIKAADPKHHAEIVADSLYRPTEAPPADRDIVNPIDPLASPEEKLAQIKKLTDENQPLVDEFLRKLDEEMGTESKSNVKADDAILSKASRPSILVEKPWHGVEHIRDTFRFKTVINSVDDLPKIAARFAKQGWQVLKVDTEKMLAPKEWGWRFVALDMRMPNGQIVEYYMPLKEMEAAKKQGHKIFEKWRNEDLFALPPESRAARDADVRESFALYQQAFEAALARAGHDDKAVRAALASFKASALSSMASKSAASAPVSLKGGRAVQAPSTRSAKKPSAPDTKTSPPSGERVTRSGAGRVMAESSDEKVSREADIAQGAMVAAEKPHLPVIGEDGATVAAEAMLRADVAEQRAQTDALGFDAAVNCFLRSGQ